MSEPPQLNRRTPVPVDVDLHKSTHIIRKLHIYENAYPNVCTAPVPSTETHSNPFHFHRRSSVQTPRGRMRHTQPQHHHANLRHRTLHSGHPIVDDAMTLRHFAVSLWLFLLPHCRRMHNKSMDIGHADLDTSSVAIRQPVRLSGHSASYAERLDNRTRTHSCRAHCYRRDDKLLGEKTRIVIVDLFIANSGDKTVIY